MAANGISELATKELRQKAKLDLAAAKRAADGNPRATYDLTTLPTQYDDNGVIDNPNAGGLVSRSSVDHDSSRDSVRNVYSSTNYRLDCSSRCNQR
jgi:hypothetical protein